MTPSHKDLRHDITVHGCQTNFDEFSASQQKPATHRHGEIQSPSMIAHGNKLVMSASISMDLDDSGEDDGKKVDVRVNAKSTTNMRCS